MKRAFWLATVSVLVGCAVVIARAAERDDINVAIVDVAWSIRDSEATGYGHGNFETSEAGVWRGFIFTADCGHRFPPSENNRDFVTAFWKKWPTRLVILLEEIGGKKISKCELKVTIRDDSQLYTRPGFAPR